MRVRGSREGERRERRLLPSCGCQIFTPAGVKRTPGGVNLTPGGMEKLQLWEVSSKFCASCQNMEGYSLFGKIIFSSVFWSV